mgnify:CR=1 FL=1
MMRSFESNHAARDRQRKNAEMCEACQHTRSIHLDACGYGHWYAPKEAGCGCSKFRRQRSATRRSVNRNAKKAESEFARALGGRRMPSGVATQARNGDWDCEGETWRLQAKHMPIPARWTEAWNQILAACTGTGKYPLVGIKTKPGPGRRSEMYIMVRLDDWISLNGTDASAAAAAELGKERR